MIYKAGRSDVFELNERLLNASKLVGDNLGIPTYATIMLGQSITSSETTIYNALSRITALNCDGWYFGFQFPEERITSSIDYLLRFYLASITFALTGKPIMHSFSGPLGLLSLGLGMTASCIGHFQNLWSFYPRRWQTSTTQQGGGGDAPPRFFSASLWGTIIFPDEIIRLPQDLFDRVITLSPFSQPVSLAHQLPWKRWEANKHLVYTIGSKIASFTDNNDPLITIQSIIELLDNSRNLYQEINNLGIILSDNTDAYQSNWRNSLTTFISEHLEDFEYLTIINSI